ncbi:hypothetical protein L0F63_003142, partial [Massospora cicadina]
MCDITPLFLDFCKSKSQKVPATPSQLRNRKPNSVRAEDVQRAISTDKLEDHLSRSEFLKEAYRILGHIDDLSLQLEKIKPAYLNVSRFRHKLDRESSSGTLMHISDSERDEIDIQSKAILNRCLQAIFRLESAEKSTKAEDLEREAEMRAAITWSLNKRAMAVSDLQKEMQWSRLARELDRQETFAWKVPSKVDSASPVQKSPDLPPVVAEAYDFAELEPIQLQALEKENKELLAQYESSLQQVMQAEKSLIEISNMQTTLATHIELQAREAERL